MKCPGCGNEMKPIEKSGTIGTGETTYEFDCGTAGCFVNSVEVRSHATDAFKNDFPSRGGDGRSGRG